MDGNKIGEGMPDNLDQSLGEEKVDMKKVSEEIDMLESEMRKYSEIIASLKEHGLDHVSLEDLEKVKKATEVAIFLREDNKRRDLQEEIKKSPNPSYSNLISFLKKN